MYIPIVSVAMTVCWIRRYCYSSPWLHQSQSIGLVVGCMVFLCWVPLCVPFIGSLIVCYFIMIVATIIWIFMSLLFISTIYLGFLKLGRFGSATTNLPGCFCPWTISFNISQGMLPSYFFMSCLNSVQGYSTEEFQALQMIVVFSSVD